MPANLKKIAIILGVIIAAVVIAIFSGGQPSKQNIANQQQSDETDNQDLVEDEEPVIIERTGGSFVIAPISTGKDLYREEGNSKIYEYQSQSSVEDLLFVFRGRIQVFYSLDEDSFASGIYRLKGENEKELVDIEISGHEFQPNVKVVIISKN